MSDKIQDKPIIIKNEPQIEPVSVEVSTEPKIKENAPVLNEIPKKVIKLEEIPEQTTNSPVEPLSTEIKPKSFFPPVAISRLDNNVLN